MAAAVIASAGIFCGSATHKRRSNRQAAQGPGRVYRPAAGRTCSGGIIAEGLARSIEGKPSVIVQNMPGAGSVVASNYLYRRPRETAPSAGRNRPTADPHHARPRRIEVEDFRA